MKRIDFSSDIPLFRALGVAPGITAVIGSGGKTSLVLRLARELVKKGRVVVSTSTRMYPPEGIPLVAGTAGAIEAALILSPLVCAGTNAEDGKLAAPQVAFPRLAELADYVLVEADGAKGLPLKAHAAHEPVVPEGARVVAVVGASGFNRPIAEAAHRPELYARALETDVNALVTPELAAQAMKARFPAKTVLVNQVDCAAALALAERFASVWGAGTVVAAALRDESAVKAIWRE